MPSVWTLDTIASSGTVTYTETSSDTGDTYVYYFYPLTAYVPIEDITRPVTQLDRHTLKEFNRDEDYWLPA
jgi:hypothetical protein